MAAHDNSTLPDEIVGQSTSDTGKNDRDADPPAAGVTNISMSSPLAHSTQKPPPEIPLG